MVKNPLEIILELMTYIIQTGIEAIVEIVRMMGELFVSLTFIAGLGMPGLIIASIIGGVVLFFVLKFLLRSTESLGKVMIVYVIFVLILIVALTLTG